MNLIYSILHIAVIAGLSFLMWKQQTMPLKRIFWPALFARLLGGLCLGWLYRWYYQGGDTFVYFDDASKLSSLARDNFVGYLQALFLNHNLESIGLTLEVPRALFLTKITSALNVVTGDQYWLTGFYFSLVSFLGAWVLVRTIAAHIPSVRSAAVIAFLFLPSAVFWSSGLLKESLAMGALFFLVALFLKVWFGERPPVWQYILGLIALLVLWNLKYYYVAVLVPVVVVSFGYRRVVGPKLRSRPVVSVMVWGALFVMPAIVVSFLHPNFNIDRIIAVMVSNNAVYNSISSPENLIRFINLNPSPWSIVLNAPLALFSGLFRPLPWEATSVTAWAAAIENTLLLILLVASLWRLRQGVTSPYRLLIFGAIVYVMILCVFLTISAPNLGTLSRYRVGYLPFFVFVILCENPLLQRSWRRFVSH